MALPLLAVGAFAAYVVAPSLGLGWLYRSGGASGLHASYLHWAAQSLAINVTGAVLGAAFLALVPRGRSWVSGLGVASMCAFLLHPFLQRWLIQQGVYGTGFVHTALGQLALTAGAALAALLLCSPPIAKIAKPFMEPRMAWFFRQG
ncbi:hypothetical protein ACFQZC_10770 [Streptacidiphilus monticola]